MVIFCIPIGIFYCLYRLFCYPRNRHLQQNYQHGVENGLLYIQICMAVSTLKCNTLT